MDARKSLSSGSLDRRQFLRRLASTTAVAGVAAGGLAGCSSSPASTESRPGPGTRRRGGNLKAGLTGGSGSDTIDPHRGVTYTDSARLQSLYNSLVQLNRQAQIEYVLAESITPHRGSPSEWVIRLRPGVTFHDGKDLGADDVIFTFRRVLTNHYSGSPGLGPVDLTGLRALDHRTVLVPMTRPYASFVEQIAAFWFYLYIAPVGFTPARPVGTGPFAYRSFTPGERSVFDRYPHYFKTGLPYVDTLTVIDFSDSTSLQNALTTGVIQAAGELDGPQIAALAGSSNVRTVVSRAGSIQPFTMRVDQPPFRDVRVRQALRLMVDRPQLINSALDGHATVASDVFSPYDPDFDPALRRQQDIPQARFLLRQAGQEHLSLTLVTSAVATGMVAMATVLAQQATGAGIKIGLKTVDPSVFFGPSYLKWTFAQDYYNYNPYLAQVGFSMLPSSPFNETHTDNAQYNRWYAEANATLDPARRKEIVDQMQHFDFNEGGYIIPAFIDGLDAYSTEITGYGPARLGQPLSNFDFEHFAFT
jgi:peptide/nickel transport system substrate-binding protein